MGNCLLPAAALALALGATYVLASDDETVTASATVEASNCTANDKSYPLTLMLVVDGRTYQSCASQAYQTLNLPMLAPPAIANPN